MLWLLSDRQLLLLLKLWFNDVIYFLFDMVCISVFPLSKNRIVNRFYIPVRYGAQGCYVALMTILSIYNLYSSHETQHCLLLHLCSLNDNQNLVHGRFDVLNQ